MDLSFTKEEMAFRDEVRAFFRDNVPPPTRQKLQEGRHLSKQEMIDWWRILNKKGWGVSHWPKEYGGTGWSSVQHYIFNEERSEEHTSELQSQSNLVCRLLLEKKKSDRTPASRLLLRR